MGTDNTILFRLAEMQRSVSDKALCVSSEHCYESLRITIFGNVSLQRESLQIDP